MSSTKEAHSTTPNNEEESEVPNMQEEETSQAKRTATLVQKEGSIATLFTTSGSSIFWVHGTLHTVRFTVMLDSGVTLNFINSLLVAKRALHTME